MEKFAYLVILVLSKVESPNSQRTYKEPECGVWGFFFFLCRLWTGAQWFSLSAVLALPLNSPIVRLDLPEFILEIYPLKGGAV